jgi:hypothetical protein
VQERNVNAAVRNGSVDVFPFCTATSTRFPLTGQPFHAKRQDLFALGDLLFLHHVVVN